MKRLYSEWITWWEECTVRRLYNEETGQWGDYMVRKLYIRGSTYNRETTVRGLINDLMKEETGTSILFILHDLLALLTPFALLIPMLSWSPDSYPVPIFAWFYSAQISVSRKLPASLDPFSWILFSRPWAFFLLMMPHDLKTGICLIRPGTGTWWTA